MDEEEYEIHPLDRDYSEPTPARRRSKIATSVDYHRGIRAAGVMIFAAGFFAVFVTAVFQNQASGNVSAERFATMLHRLAMVIILVGGVTVFAAYRLPESK